MSGIGSGNVVPLRVEVTSEQLETAARDLVEKHWSKIDQAAEDSRDVFAALLAEANAIAHELKLSPDAIDKFCELALADIKARFQRKSARKGVEDFWRTLISVGQSCSSAVDVQAKAAQLEQIFRGWIDKTVASLSPAEASAFQGAVEDEDKALALLRQTDRKAFFQRLNLPDSETPVPRSVAQHHQSLGEVAVKTAVRAAVWEGVRALFRAF